MEPLPQTAEALRELARQGEPSLGIELFAIAEKLRPLVPELVGLSLAATEDGVVLTLASSDEELAALDAVQYLDGGPCVTGVEDGEIFDVSVSGLLDEGRWQLYAQASAAVGVASSLSLPIMDARGERVIGGANLYASSPNAFAGRHEEIARAIGSEARLAVGNADLRFATREAAREAPRKVRESGDVNVALGIIAASQGISITEAQMRLSEAAARAGISEAQAARAIQHIRH